MATTNTKLKPGFMIIPEYLTQPNTAFNIYPLLHIYLPIIHPINDYDGAPI